MTISSTPPLLKRLRVLYLEDHDSLRFLVAECMRKAGYEVETAGDGTEGWGKLSASPFDLVVTDLQMPNLDGIGFIRLLRQSARPLRIIVYSAFMAESTLLELRNLSVDAIIPKGYQWELLLESMAEVTGPDFPHRENGPGLA